MIHSGVEFIRNRLDTTRAQYRISRSVHRSCSSWAWRPGAVSGCADPMPGLLPVVSLLWAWIGILLGQSNRAYAVTPNQVGNRWKNASSCAIRTFCPNWLEVRDYSTMPVIPFPAASSIGCAPEPVFVAHKTISKSAWPLPVKAPFRIRTSDPFGLFPMRRDIERNRRSGCVSDDGRYSQLCAAVWDFVGW